MQRRSGLGRLPSLRPSRGLLEPELCWVRQPPSRKEMARLAVPTGRGFTEGTLYRGVSRIEGPVKHPWATNRWRPPPPQAPEERRKGLLRGSESCSCRSGCDRQGGEEWGKDGEGRMAAPQQSPLRPHLWVLRQDQAQRTPFTCHRTLRPAPSADLAHQQGPHAFHPPEALTGNQGGSALRS